MRRVALGVLSLAALGALACLGPYPNLGEKLDTGKQVSGTSHLAVDGGAARILILASPDGGPPPGFTRIDEQQPRAVETLKGTYAASGAKLTFSSTTLFTLPDEITLPVTRRVGASRRQLSPPEVDEAVVDSS